ncbi:hypothetical protein BP5796_04633 [Coleophoma crateriformis]|uniref:Mediator of RNA polymerase II transcription subunit 10 n=1 Tax=Coleophoma crateriformis TaxID=565419 RepID=A0A3D8S9V6_9HELO|nr:hypothetical protein BP5796_04633 [Coleophoma crateriformis]
MAPDRIDEKVVENQIKDVIQDLYQVMVQVTAYDLTSRPSKDVLENSTIQLQHSLQKIHNTANSPTAQATMPSVPPELIQYVDTGRNPDIYTREFVERTRKMNQTMKGKFGAFSDFRDVLATEMARAMPELIEDIGLVVERTHGDKEKVMRNVR